MKIIAIVQARMGSSRLPGKVLMNICGKPVLWHIVNRAKKSNYLDSVIIATSTEPEDDEIERFAYKYDIAVFRGSQDNVLERFYQCAGQCNAECIVRLTGDNTLIDPHIIDKGIEYFMGEKELDYLSYREGLPLGMSVEIFTYRALETAYLEATDMECLEHVTPYLYHNKDKFKVVKAECEGVDHSELRWTLDTRQDYELIQKIYEKLYTDAENIFSYEDILKEYANDWKLVNAGIRQVKIEYTGEQGKE